MNEWTKIGEIGVDSGMCYIGDPCYILKEEMTGLEALSVKTWKDLCDGLEDSPLSKQLDYAPGHPGLGVITSTGWGDGFYDVMAKIVEGRIAEVKIVFIQEGEYP